MPVHPLRFGKRAVERPICVQPRKVVPGNTVDCGKATANNDLPIGLNGDGEHFAVYTLAGAKSRGKRYFVLRVHRADGNCQQKEERFHGDNPPTKSLKIKL